MEKLVQLLSFSLMLELCLSISLYAQERTPLIFGGIEPEWVEIENFGSFPGADAVIIHDFGLASIELTRQSPQVRYIFHKKIKILTAKGLKYAQIEIPIDHREEDESLIDLRAATYNLNARGEVVQFPIPRRKMHQSKVGKGKYIVKLDFPFAKVGSVIEFLYQVRSGKLDELKTWKFQQEIPVIKSEYQTLIPYAYDYLPVLRGDTRLMKTYNEGFRQRIGQNNTVSRYGDIYEWRGVVPIRNFSSISGKMAVYIMENVDVPREESFSLGKESYIPSISLQLSKDFLTNRSNQNLFDSWEQLNKQVARRYKARKINLKKKDIQKLAHDFVGYQKTQTQIVNSIVNYVRSQLAWNREYGIKPNKLDRVLESGIGAGIDINLLLMHMLRAAGFNANPVLISTLDHGRLTPLYPIMDQFNHLIVSLMLNGEELLLDGTEEMTRMGILPKNDLNQVGFRLDEEGGQWIKLQSRNKVNQVTYSRFDLDIKGNLHGDISVQNRDYSMVLEQDKLKNYEEKALDYLKEQVLIGMTNPDITNQSVSTSVDEEDMLVVKCNLTTHDFVKVAGDHIIIQPMMIKMVSKNPFQGEERITPVDFPYPMSDSHMLGLRIPDGYSVAQLPKPIRVVLPNNAGSFTYNVLEMGNIIHFTSSIQINKTTFMPEEYPGIRAFFEYVVKKHQEDIILQKIQ